MELKDGQKTFYAKSRKEWRRWLEKNHAIETRVWLILYKKNSTTKSVTYAEAVEEALCFGWIDSKANTRDAESYYQYFAQRKPKGIWSKINRERVGRLILEGRMTPAGQAVINQAKKSKAWFTLEEVDNLVIPEDLQKRSDRNKTALNNFQAFSISARKMILWWIKSAKRPETRKKRIEETVTLAAKNIRANH